MSTIKRMPPDSAVGQKVQVYRNLTRSCYSLRQNGKVIGHLDGLILSDCTFRVSQAGRNRVLREKRKNVHAFVEGTLCIGRLQVEGNRVTIGSTKSLKSNPLWPLFTNSFSKVSYNPYEFPYFYNDRKEPVICNSFALLEEKGLYILQE